MLSGLSSPTLLQQAVAPVTALLNTTLTPEEPSASASTPTQTPTAPDDGVVFDLSDAALTTLQNAQTSPQGADESAAPAASGSAPRSGATWAAAPAAQTQGTFAARLAEAEVDPDEEARARAAAVTAMERAAIQSIIENIKATRESKVDAAEAVAAVADTPRGPVPAPSDMPTRAAG